MRRKKLLGDERSALKALKANGKNISSPFPKTT